MELPEFMRRRQKYVRPDSSMLGKPSQKAPTPPPDMHSPIQCEDCGRWSKPQGVRAHKRFCKGKDE
jgi:hypothetical protein